MPKETSSFQEMIGCRFRQLYPDHQPWAGPIKFTITVYLQRKKSSKEYPTVKPDYDNIAKIVADGLSGIAYIDDRQIVEAHQSKNSTQVASGLTAG